jgi:hypothetical protein
MHEQEGEAFLLHVESGRYFGLNRSGVVIWRALEKGADPIEALAEQWPDLPLDVRKRDAEALLERLAATGLVRDDT